MMHDDPVNTVLRLDGTVVTIAPTAAGRYELIVEHDDRRSVREVAPDVVRDPLNTPEFAAIVEELKTES